MDARIQSALLAAIVALALATAMLLRPHRSRLYTLFALLNLDLFVYEMCDFVAGVLQAPVWMRVALAAAALLPAAALGFFLEFLDEAGPRARRTLRSAFAGGVLGALVAASPLAEINWVRGIIAGWAFAMLAVTITLLYRRMRRAPSRTERARLLYVCVGAAAAVLFSATDLLPRAGLPFPPIGNVAVTVYLYFLSQALLRHRLLDLNEVLGKLVVLSTLALLLASVIGSITFWVGDRPGLLLFNTLVAAFVILILLEPLRSKVEEWAVRLLFRERYEFVRALEAIRARMASVIDVKELSALMLDGLYETRRVTHCSIYLLSDDGLGFRRLDHRGPSPAPYLDAASARALVQAAASGQRALLVENLERRLAELRALSPPAPAGESSPAPSPLSDETQRLNEIAAAMAAMRAGVCVPLMSAEHVVGFLDLLDDRVPEAFASDELAAMLEVADQAAIAVENSRLYERMKERDRLAALGEMAAGLAHEIRNPLGAIKGAAQFLDPRSVPASEGEFLGIIVEEVNRLNGVVSEFLEYSRPLKDSFQPTDLNDVIARTVKLLTSNGLPPAVLVDLELSEGLPRIDGDADQLKQVFINLALNAVQAMPEGGRLTIVTRRPRAGEWRVAESEPRYLGDAVEVRFRDTGPGIPDDMRERIFIPFYTTKEKGTGLGLAICQRIVRNHRGTIEVQSRQGEGTEFILRLPAARTQPPPPLPA